MKPPVEGIRIGRRGRDQLMKLRKAAGIENWNVWCRWALCASLREPAVPPTVEADSETGIDLSWKTFAGEHSDVYAALLLMRWRKDTAKGVPMEQAEYFRRHIHRGINFLDAKLETCEGYELLPLLVAKR